MNEKTHDSYFHGMSPIHPGEILKEDYLEPLKLSATAFAVELGMTTARVCEILSGKRGISANTAIRLAKKLDTSPFFWMNLQANYDIQKELENLKELEIRES